jgi:FkbM family methyltransferase
MYFKDKTEGRVKHSGRIKCLKKLFPQLSLADLGSAGGTPPPYCYLSELIDVVSFEPDTRVDPSLNLGEVKPVAIGPGELTTFHLNRRPFTSSLLPPCRRVVDRYDFSQFKDVEGCIFETVGTKEVRTLGFDEALNEFERQSPDFIKIDVQGLTLEVLESARTSLAGRTLGVQVEVEFLESYEGQRTFGDVHNLMLDLGYEIYMLNNLCKWFFKTRLPLKHKKNGQHTFCDLTYFRSIDSCRERPLEGDAPRRLLSLLLINDLNDSAAAFFELFEEQGLLTGETLKNWRELIVEWPGLFDYLFDNQSDSV